MKALHDSRGWLTIGIIAGVCGLYALAGCSADNVSGTPSLLDGATASAATDGTDAVARPDQGGERDAGRGIPYLPRPVGQEAIPEGGTYDPVTHWFICPPETDEHGATIQRSYAFFDAGGALQTAYDETLTDAIGLRFELQAQPEFETHTGSIVAEHDLLLRGLAGEEETRIWSGTLALETSGVPPRHPGQSGDGPGGERGGPGGPGGPGGFGGPRGSGGPGAADRGGRPDRAHEGDERPSCEDLHVVERTTIADVVLPYPLEEQSWPLAGAIERQTQVRGGPQDVNERHSVLTFNGTRYATLTIGDETIEIDLLSPPQPPRPPQE